MDWWQAFLLAAGPAAITGASLLLQQRSSIRLERAKIADLANDRQHQRALAAEASSAEHQRLEIERSWQLASDWRLERREAHVRLLNLMYEAHDDLSRVALRDILTDMTDTAPLVADDLFQQDWGHSLTSALASVQIISSESSATTAESAATPLIQTYFSLTSPKPELRTAMKLKELHSKYHDCRSEYIEAARAEVAAFGSR
jgi:hypothetical protein